MKRAKQRRLNLLVSFSLTCAILVGNLSIPYAVLAQTAIWKTYYCSAQREYQKGNLIAAESLLLEALHAECQPDESLSTYYYLAHICTRREHFEDAEKYYGTLLQELGTKTWAVLRPPDGTPDWEQDSSTVDFTSDGSEFYALLNKKPPPLLSIKLAKPITIVDVLADYGTLLQMEKNYPEAEKAFRQALILSDCRPDQAKNYEVGLLQKLSVLYSLEGRTQESDIVMQQLTAARNNSIPNFEEIVDNTIKGLNRFGRNTRTLAIRLNNLGLFCATHGDYGRAQDLFSRALSCLNDKPSANKKEKAIIIGNLADLYLAMGKVSEASDLNKQAISLGMESTEAQSINKVASH